LGDPTAWSGLARRDIVDLKTRGLAHTLLERDAALEAVVHALDSARDGAGAVLFVVAGAGMGKTSVLAVGGRAAGAAGFRVASGVGSGMEVGLPFGLLGQAIEALGGSVVDDLDEVARLGGQSARLYRMFRWLTEVATERPLLLVLDDLQWADPDSLELLGFLSRRLAGKQMMVLGALRPEPDPAWTLAQELIGAGRASVVWLEPLSAQASVDLVERVVPGALADGRRELVVQGCAGTPLLLEVAASRLRTGQALPALSGGFGSRLLLERFAGVGADAFAFVRAAAILGVRFKAELAGALAALDDAAWEEAWGRLSRAGLLDDLGSGWAAFVHPLFAQALVETFTRSERERIHARAFQLLVERGEPNALAAEHALMARLLGDPLAIEVTARTGREALAHGALESACTHLANAVELAGSTATAELLLDYAQTLTARARIGEAADVCEGLVARADLEPGLNARTLALLARGAILTGRPDEGERLYEQAAIAAAHDSPALEAATLADAANTCQTSSPIPWAVATISRATAIVPPGAALRRSLEFLGAYARLMGGDPVGEELLTDAIRGWLTTDEAGDDRWGWTITASAINALKLLENPAAATELFEREFEKAVQAGAPIAMSALAITFADTVHRLGRLGEALEVVGRAVALSDRSIFWFDVGLAVGLVEFGRDEDAQPHIDVIRARTAAVAPEYFAPVSLWLCVLDGWRLLALGEVERASETMLHAAEVARLSGWRHPSIVPWAGVGIDAHLAAGRVDRATALIDDLDQLSRPLSARWPRAVVALGRARLAAAAGRSADADRGFQRALEMFAQLPFPIYHAEALVSYGGNLRRSGRPREARVPLALALEICEWTGAERVARLARPELAAAGGRRRRRDRDPGELTAQEQRVAALAADGLSNAQIAAALHLSPKTVEHHLEHVYRKLGITSRRDLIRRWDPAERVGTRSSDEWASA
jgi:DNA-binding CsgD family transcriptional regulator